MMKKGSSPAPAPAPVLTTPEPSGVIYEAPPPPPAATARFVPVAPAPGDTAPAFPIPMPPMLGINIEIETPPTGYSRVLLGSLPKFEKETDLELEMLEASPSESFDVMTLTPIFGALHAPSSDHRQVNHANSNHFLRPMAKSVDELIDELLRHEL